AMRFDGETYGMSNECLFYRLEEQAKASGNPDRFKQEDIKVTEDFKIVGDPEKLSLQGTLSITSEEKIVERLFTPDIKRELEEDWKYEIELSMTVEDDMGKPLKLRLNDNDKMNFEFKLDTEK
ncbi:MAG: hypothetical protein P8J27_06290, partial [Mariniblastus sp.]|nr:hypothetical protein [Mariniblastus sp.]